MKIFIDASLLIYLNTLKTPGKRGPYEEFYLDLLSKYKAYTDVLVLDETIYVSAKKYKVPYEISLDFIDHLVMPFVRILPLGEDEYKEAAEIIKKYGVKPSDALHVAAMMLNGIVRVASEDRELDKVEGINRVWLVSL